jgi:hypothetical protein
MRPQDFLYTKFKDVKFRIQFPNEIVTSEEEIKKAQQAILCNIKDALQDENYIIKYLNQLTKKLL